MSLGLPEFGSRGQTASGGSSRKGVQVVGLVAFTYVLGVALVERQAAYSADLVLQKARDEVARAAKSAEETRRSLQKNSDVLVAVASVESSPERVLKDLGQLLPQGVLVGSIKIDYMPDATTRVELSVAARGPELYDRFLEALSKSASFADIKPGAESRPGLVRANVTATHRSKVIFPETGSQKTASPKATSPREASR